MTDNVGSIGPLRKKSNVPATRPDALKFFAMCLVYVAPPVLRAGSRTHSPLISDVLVATKDAVIYD